MCACVCVGKAFFEIQMQFYPLGFNALLDGLTARPHQTWGYMKAAGSLTNRV